ncbi:RNA 2',3'-cyclic phosphodiesterase [Sporolactobacillus sp. STSJ-5]|uniref:RNA 2',3'-cyclic phosphodiesterase n=1 Tax=Sporolactobacillus sp. STSJ-5 TaxID=2965076 RepID=UPI002107C45B|nr:RNA 2',3'-cyclic phosphodiesterase [Sporolactobacillus sp. STSJ-5]MCQ2008699.1 RNA 2',3'-cyclic phosphodiesterase [Sporolactobacillus sp. STSJ-5]
MTDHYFLAIPLADELRIMTCQAATPFMNNIHYKRRTNPADLHCTLLFFGALDEEKRAAVVQTVSQISRRHHSFHLKLSGIDGFGEKHRPRVLFASLFPNQELHQLRSDLGQALSIIGFNIEKRPFHPHITLAKRWIDGEMRVDLPITDCAITGKSWEVCSMMLFKVQPETLPHYLPVFEFPFLGE